MSGAALEAEAPLQPKAPSTSSKDDRTFRPSSLKELYAITAYKPFVLNYTKSTGEVVEYNVASYLSCEDLGIMCACFLTLWSCLLGIYVLLLKAALDTDEKATALWIFFVFGVIFVLFVLGAVGMNGIEEHLIAKHNPKVEEAL
ncbi:hypothetical protein M885DRAFT_510335 [Pelagophyceae sp. CCMP2097]|nr:hypothetical protein M885DRAFT_510335 [Pelagophyceae sp. CCMP2097]|mmetsp:Transcript_16521/g.58682  ORF Transcript_16521/g.58682 Transcript_16521/m.58682 type:complete len:144 (+) Transcript_16521:63-494(+)